MYVRVDHFYQEHYAMRRQQTIVRKPASKFAHLNKKMEQAKIRERQEDEEAGQVAPLAAELSQAFAVPPQAV